MSSRFLWCTSLVGTVPMLVLALSLAGCGSGGGGSKGTCRTTGGCGDDFTKGQCSLINGSFSKGKSCALASDTDVAVATEHNAPAVVNADSADADEAE